jgi:hypothetical protein
MVNSVASWPIPTYFFRYMPVGDTLFRVPLLFSEFSELLIWTSVSSNTQVSCGSALPLVDGKWSIISLMALGPITTRDSFQASGIWRCNWDDGVCSVNRCVFTIPDDGYRTFVSVKMRHANIVNFTMFTVQANDQLSFQTVKILVLMVEHAIYYYEIEPFQSFLEGFVFENRE